MPRTETELTDEQAHKAKEVLRRLKADAGSSRALAEHLERLTGKRVPTQTVVRWVGKSGRPSLEAWRLLVQAQFINDAQNVPVAPRRAQELDPDDIAELKLLAKRLQRIVERLR